MLGWKHKAGIPAAFRKIIPGNPNKASPDLLNGQSFPGAVPTLASERWYCKIIRKTTQPPKHHQNCLLLIPEKEHIVACTALWEGWADSPGVLLADVLAWVNCPLYDYQEEI
jgi:hypothetical protein